MDKQFELPLDYRVRVSHRARCVRLRMSIQEGLEIVIPRGYNPRDIPGVIARKQAWIDRIRQRFDQIRKTTPPIAPPRLPETIVLAALGETWTVHYRETPAKTVRVKIQPDWSLEVYGPVSHFGPCQKALLRWLFRRGEEMLPPWLRKVSDELHLPFGRVVMRLQKTRWASCSCRKTISLNLKLLFLSPELVRYLFIHELSHTVHMNHSVRYWRFVAQKDPEFREHERQMKIAWKSAPSWI